jgi:3-phosphoshikimate 1-carboxyvinyltransferase
MAGIKLELPEHTSLSGEINLEYSKSESNRVLIIKYLSETIFSIINLSRSEDTVLLNEILACEESDNGKGEASQYDVHHAGTAMRFLCAYFANRKGTYLLTGSNRMQERPIHPLVNALRHLGADITYAKREGFPPLQIKGKKLEGGVVEIDADVSSQYITALMLIAPTLPEGLKIVLKGKPVSTSYTLMTARIMEKLGIHGKINQNEITITRGRYHLNKASNYYIEADWSAASYFYAISALNPGSEFFLNGLFKNSVQPDVMVVKLFDRFGVSTEFMDAGVKIKSVSQASPEFFEFDFTLCPDLTQTMAVLCAAKKIPSKFTGVSTLRIKETDRVQALKNELHQFNIELEIVDEHSFLIHPENANFESQNISIKTYSDHRMAMSFAILCSVCNHIEIKDHEVVKKSFPDFWNQLSKCGINIIRF